MALGAVEARVAEAGPGTCRFMGVDLELGPNVLVPRQETELLGNAALSLLGCQHGHTVVVDMCCGAGNLACAVASRKEDVCVWACDLTDETVAVAERNVARLGLEDRVTVVQGDLFSNLPLDKFAGKVDLVMCNPPYISTGRLEGESAHLLESEPREAFDAGPYGISIHQRVIRDAAGYLKPGGWFACEFGAGQQRQVAALVARTKAYDEPQFINDEAGVPRVMVARRKA